MIETPRSITCLVQHEYHQRYWIPYCFTSSQQQQTHEISIKLEHKRRVHVLRNLKRKQMKNFDDWTRCFNLLMEMASWTEHQKVFHWFFTGGFGFVRGDIESSDIGNLEVLSISWCASTWSILPLIIKTELFDSRWVTNIWSFNGTCTHAYSPR